MHARQTGIGSAEAAVQPQFPVRRKNGMRAGTDACIGDREPVRWLVVHAQRYRTDRWLRASSGQKEYGVYNEPVYD